MALNFYRKINETFVRNCTRFLQNNAQKLAPVLEENAQAVKEVEKTNQFAISSQFRTTPPENPRLWNSHFEPERDIIYRQLENRYLQPATLPSYRDEPIFDNKFMDTLQEGPIKKAQTFALNNSASQQILESFKKKQAQNLPTRIPKLISNPFPEPLKPTFSPYTLSDQEKADQMLMDQQALQLQNRPDFSAAPCTMRTSKKFFCTTSRPQDLLGLHSRDGTLNSVRCYSKKSGGAEVCKDDAVKKQKSCLPKKCNKITLKGCPPVRKNTVCKQKNLEVKCKKVEAPYPSYSESCYMEPRPRQRECEVCPWTEKNNPNFRGKLKKPPQFYHTQCFPSLSTGNPTGSVLMKSVRNEHKKDQIWLHKANLSQIYMKGMKMPSLDFLDSVKTSNIAKNADVVESDEVQSSINIGYCDRHKTVLTEFFMKNDELLANFKNGDDLSEFGIKKTKLSKLLSSKEVFDVFCKKGERIIPDYPKDCDRPYQDTTKTCPSGLTRKKTKKDRMKRKAPKDQSCT